MVPASAPPGYVAVPAVIPTASTPSSNELPLEVPQPSAAALGKHRLIDIRFDPVVSFSLSRLKSRFFPLVSAYLDVPVHICVLSNVQNVLGLDANLITTSTLNLWYGLCAVRSDTSPQSVNGDDAEIAVSCTDVRKFCELFQHLDLSRLSALVESHQIKDTDNTRGVVGNKST
ncbi:hypothetical protein C8J57DRAFT_1718014 [Mycena rebaudengoi]|nr:hypothetical protein C8J57DRAFT_1718014 [Mycena rebaudengoi]